MIFLNVKMPDEKITLKYIQYLNLYRTLFIYADLESLIKKICEGKK